VSLLVDEGARMFKNTMLDVAFTVIHEFEDPYDLLSEENVHLVFDALQRRIDYLRRNVHDAGDAFGVNDTFDVCTELP